MAFNDYIELSVICRIFRNPLIPTMSDDWNTVTVIGNRRGGAQGGGGGKERQVNLAR